MELVAEPELSVIELPEPASADDSYKSSYRL